MVPRPTYRQPSEEWPQGAGDGKTWDIPLGPPIVRVSIDDLQDSEKIAKYISLLLETIYLDQENITYRRLGVHNSKCLIQYTTNEGGPPGVWDFYAYNYGPGANTPGQIQALVPIVTALAFNFHAQDHFDKLIMLKDVFKLIPLAAINEELKSRIPELFSE